MKKTIDLKKKPVRDGGERWKRTERRIEVIGLVLLFAFYALIMTTMENQMAKAVQASPSAAAAAPTGR